MWYKGEIFLLLYVDDCIIFSHSKDKIYDICDSLQADFSIENNGDLNNYFGIELERRPDGSIHLS